MQKKADYCLIPNPQTVVGIVFASWLLWRLEANFLYYTFGATAFSVAALLAGMFATPWLLFCFVEKVVFLLFVKRKL